MTENRALDRLCRIFGAATANISRVMNGLSAIDWSIQKDFDYILEYQEWFNYKSSYRKKTKGIVITLIDNDQFRDWIF